MAMAVVQFAFLSTVHPACQRYALLMALPGMWGWLARQEFHRQRTFTGMNVVMSTVNFKTTSANVSAHIVLAFQQWWCARLHTGQ